MAEEVSVNFVESSMENSRENGTPTQDENLELSAVSQPESNPDSALKEPLKPTSDISDSEFDDLGNLAVKPVEKLSNVSSSPDKNQDEEVSLSGLSSPEADRLQILEDGEINGHKSNSSEDQDSDNRRNRRFRNRNRRKSSSSPEKSEKSPSPENFRRSRRSSSSPRASIPKKKGRELPRYDVRNVINRKRAAKKSSRSRSRSRSKNLRRRRKSRSRSRSPPKRDKRSKNRGRSWSRSRSRSRSRRRSSPNLRRSRSPILRRSRSPIIRRSRSPILRRSRSPPLRRLRTSRSPRKRSKSPELTPRKKRKNAQKRQKSRSRSRSRSKTRKSKKAGKGNKNGAKEKRSKKSKKSKRQQRTVQQKDQDDLVLHNSSSVANKEVFTSGDKIMVSVNFKNAANKSAAEIAATKKPSLVIDIMSSPYQVIEPSPEPLIDVYSDEESPQITKTPPPLKITEKSPPEKSPPEISVVPEKGPQTPPQGPETLDLARGPQTPEDPSDYDPCNPTESPELEIEDDDEIFLHSGSSSSSGKEDLLKTAANTIPFLMDETLIRDQNNSTGVSSTTNNENLADFNDLPVDMDMDSPFSPQSSEGSDIFEPPTPTKKGRKQNGVSSTTKKSRKNQNNNKHVQMKIVDDKLKIIDDVPTSAVEMAVKEKFLKKVQRQERVVEEIKTVLKPHYNRKRITKEDYKDILRKCVPKVCHSKKGDINPAKIQKLVKGYVRKYHHARKRTA